MTLDNTRTLRQPTKDELDNWKVQYEEFTENCMGLDTDVEEAEWELNRLLNTRQLMYRGYAVFTVSGLNDRDELFEFAEENVKGMWASMGSTLDGIGGEIYFYFEDPAEATMFKLAKG